MTTVRLKHGQCLEFGSGSMYISNQKIGVHRDFVDYLEKIHAALDSANQRAEEAEKHKARVGIESVRLFEENETLKASLADKDRELETSKLIEITHNATIQELDAELSSLRERLRWRDSKKYPIPDGPVLVEVDGEIWQVNAPCKMASQSSKWFAIPTESPDTVDGDGVHFDPDLVGKS